MDDAGTEHADGWILVADGLVEAVGGGEPPVPTSGSTSAARSSRPGLVNTHHHLYQTLTRARAQEADLFTWLQTLYPVWARLDEESVYAAARTGLAELALSGCTTVFDHHYLFPRGRRARRGGGARGARARRAHRRLARLDGSRRVGRRPAARLARRGARRRSSPTPSGPPRSQDATASCRSRSRPCSPFSVTKRADARVRGARARLGLQLHTHLAETVEEEAYCRELYGCRRSSTSSDSAGSTDDVWCAHCVHLSDADVAHVRARRASASRTARPRTCGSARASRRSRELLDAGVRVGLGVDGSASNERGDLFLEVKQALLVARGRGGPGGDVGARRAPPRHARRRGGARPRRHRLARAGQARRPRGLGDRRARVRRRRRPGREPRLRRPAPGRAAVRRRRGGRLGRPPRQRGRGRRSPRSTARRREGSRSEHLDPRPRHRAPAGPPRA